MKELIKNASQEFYDTFGEECTNGEQLIVDFMMGQQVTAKDIADWWAEKLRLAHQQGYREGVLAAKEVLNNYYLVEIEALLAKE